jgi:hypothetical protein
MPPGRPWPQAEAESQDLLCRWGCLRQRDAARLAVLARACGHRPSPPCPPSLPLTSPPRHLLCPPDPHPPHPPHPTPPHPSPPPQGDLIPSQRLLELGATCTMALLQGSRLVLADVGDSAAVMGRWGQLQPPLGARACCRWPGGLAAGAELAAAGEPLPGPPHVARRVFDAPTATPTPTPTPPLQHR